MEIKVPEVGESVREAQVAKWHQADGASVAKDAVLCELETDKITLELRVKAQKGELSFDEKLIDNPGNCVVTPKGIVLTVGDMYEFEYGYGGKTVINLHLKDGALGDADGLANGEIDDPGAPAVDTTIIGGGGSKASATMESAAPRDEGAGAIIARELLADSSFRGAGL